jgi:RNA-directed DNA polymerase
VRACSSLAAYELAVRWQERRPLGTIQGGAISPLLANIYLHPFDLALTSQGLRLVRFMDDFVIMCASRAEAEAALELVVRQLETLRLRVNPAKTQIVNYGEGLEFLGQALAPRRRGPTLEQGLTSFEEADERIRAAIRQARAGAAKARRALRSRRGPKKGDA